MLVSLRYRPSMWKIVLLRRNLSLQILRGLATTCVPCRDLKACPIHRNSGSITTVNRLSSPHSLDNIHSTNQYIRRFRHDGGWSGRDDISHLFVPVPIKAREDEINVGAEITGPLQKKDILWVLKRFFTDKNIRELAGEHGLDDYLYQQTFMSFRKFCIESGSLPVELHIIISDILQGAAHIHDIYPSFRKHAMKIFPHLNCLDDLCMISDLSTPSNWYPEARAMKRKIIFHAGPTNSGKTYHAMQQFLSADSGVYCGPLKLLATEVFNKSNNEGTPCDLVTGEERRFGMADGTSANHLSCTVEMTSVSTKYDVAVIDEIQMVRDQGRGWAWTRAFLGLCAREIHVCGEESAVEIVKEIAMTAGEEVEVRRYKRLTPLVIENSGLQKFDNIHKGDCIVCFSKRDIHYVSREIEKKGHEVAVLYGGLPPGTKLAQAYKFNDPKQTCKVLIATDAIGMGLNLSIRRIIFYSLIKPSLNEKGEIEMETITVSAALQIAGRAGRYGTQWPQGYVTTMKSEDLPTLRRLLEDSPSDIEQAGLHPTADQIELFAYHLPNYTLSNLIDIFVSLCKVDSSLYFMCMMNDFKFLADLIEHVPLQLRARYVFCCSPINRKASFVCAMFLKFVRQFSQNEAATVDWLCHHVKWPLATPNTVLELVHLEVVFDVFDIYLWLSYRFPDMFPDGELVRGLQSTLDEMIEDGVSNITTLLRNSSTPISNLADTEDSLIMDRPMKNSDRGFNMPQSQLPKDHRMEKGAVGPARQTEKKPHSKVPKDHRKEKGDVGYSRLTERLLAQGLLTPKMLAELQREWQEQATDDDLPPSPSKPKPPRKRK